MKVHMVQLDCVWEDPEANRVKVEGLLAGLRCEEGDLVVLPEMFLTGFSLKTEVTVQASGGEHEAMLARLTAREQQVLERIVAGRLNKQIADDLGISIKTVETHRAAIMRKLGLHSIGELVRYAIRNHIIEA